MDLEGAVAAHYGRPGLETIIVAALAEAGIPEDRISPETLAPVDEFHLGWRAATLRLITALRLAPEHHVLDLGAGIGGPARTIASRVGCRVTGVDLTPEFVAAGNGLSRRCGLGTLVDLVEGSILALPFEAGTFDRAVLIHVGMNIADKAGAFAESRRVLKPDGLLGVFDIMSDRPDDIPFPMPWAETSETSAVEGRARYRAFLEEAGFTVEAEEDWSGFVLDRMAEMRAEAERSGTDPLGLHTLVGPAIKPRLANVAAALKAGVIAPVLMLARPA